MIKQLIIPATVAGSLLFSATAQAMSLVIDDFNSNAQDVEISTGTDSDLATGIPVANTLGGSRNIGLTITGEDPFGNTAQLAVIPMGTPQVLDWSNENNVTSMGTVTWDASGSGLNLDLTTFDTIGINLLQVDQNAEIGFTLVDGMSNTASLSQTGLTPGFANFTFSQFMDFGSLDLTDIDTVFMTLDGPEAVDLRIDIVSFEVVPEPGTVLGLLAFGGAGLLARRRQK